MNATISDLASNTSIIFRQSNTTRSIFRLSVYDYVCCFLFVTISTVIGLYFGFFKSKNNITDYLYAADQISIIPIAMSLMTSVISPISIFGLLPEVYYYGCQRVYATVLSVPFSILIVGLNLTPFLYDLEVKTFFEYFELRFNKLISIIAAFFFIAVTLFQASIIMYIPASFLNYTSGVPTHTVTTMVYVLCIFYTTIGGMKAVVWTDFFEGIIMFLAVITVLVASAIQLSNENIWAINEEGMRLDVVFKRSELRRDTMIDVLIGTTFTRIIFHFGGQATIQRIKSLSSVTLAKKTMILSILAIETFFFVNLAAGLLAYARYHACDPLLHGDITKKAQLYPHFALHAIGKIPGLTGVLIGGLLCGACGTMSSVMNAVGATIYLEFVPKKCIKRELWLVLVKVSCLFAGIISYFAGYLVGYIGEVFPLFLMAQGVFSGTIFGLFLLGSLVPQSNATGAAVGSILSFSFMMWILLGSQLTIALGQYHRRHLPLSIKGCPDIIGGIDDFTGEIAHNETMFVLYHLSQYYYGPLCTFLTIVIGTIVSYLTGPTDIMTVQRGLLNPLIHKFLPLRPPSARRVSRIYVDDSREDILNVLAGGVDFFD